MKIGIDIDDTIANTHDILFSYAQKYTAEDLKKELSQPKSEIMSGNGYCARFHEWNKEEDKEFWRKYYGIEGTSKKIEIRYTGGIYRVKR